MHLVPRLAASAALIPALAGLLANTVVFAEYVGQRG